MRAQAQRLRESLQADPPWTGAHEWKNAQRSHALQGKGKGARAGKHSGANAHAAGCGAIPGPSAPSKLPRRSCPELLLTVPVLYLKRIPSQLGSTGSAGSEDTDYFPSRFYIERVEGPGIAPHLAACTFTLPCLLACPRPLPLQRLALLHVLLLVRPRPQRTRLHIPPQARCPGTRFHGFPPLRSCACLHPFRCQSRAFCQSKGSG
jgi:hypothetical protein